MSKISGPGFIAVIIFILSFNIGLFIYGYSLLVEEIWFIGLLYFFLILTVDVVFLITIIRLRYSSYTRVYE